MTSGPRRELSVDEITELLTDLGRRLSARGVSASVYIVGDAAIAIDDGMARRRR